MKTKIIAEKSKQLFNQLLEMSKGYKFNKKPQEQAESIGTAVKLLKANKSLNLYDLVKQLTDKAIIEYDVRGFLVDLIAALSNKNQFEVINIIINEKEKLIRYPYLDRHTINKNYEYIKNMSILKFNTTSLKYLLSADIFTRECLHEWFLKTYSDYSIHNNHSGLLDTFFTKAIKSGIMDIATIFNEAVKETAPDYRTKQLIENIINNYIKGKYKAEVINNIFKHKNSKLNRTIAETLKNLKPSDILSILHSMVNAPEIKPEIKKQMVLFFFEPNMGKLSLPTSHGKLIVLKDNEEVFDKHGGCP
ncbi:MAG: hypothetical protein PHV30_05185 [Candidatus Margulisbacteria bacterium]|nr:hypothetical protein [Candidatus Margulisiibacteriota bacterium]